MSGPTYQDNLVFDTEARSKNFTITINRVPTGFFQNLFNYDLEREYLLPIVSTVIAIFILYVMGICFMLAMGHYERMRLENDGRAIFHVEDGMVSLL